MTEHVKTLSDTDRKKLTRYLNSAYALRSSLGKRDRVMVLLMLQCGLRVSEACDLKPGDVRDGWVWVVDGKGGKSRKVEAPRPLLEAIDVWVRARPDSDWLLCTLASRGGGSEGQRLSRQGVSRRLKVIQRRAGIAETGCHVLRHTFATVCLENDVPLEKVSKALGHSSLNTTRGIYDHSSGARGTAGVWE